MVAAALAAVTLLAVVAAAAAVVSDEAPALSRDELAATACSLRRFSAHAVANDKSVREELYDEIDGGRPVVVTGHTFDEQFWSIEHLGEVFPGLYDVSDDVNVAEDEAMRAQLREHYDVPEWLNRDGLVPTFGSDYVFVGRLMDVNDRHIDSGCAVSFSFQLAGVKLWDLDNPGNRSAGADDFDSCVLHPGDVLVFYPGWYHETTVLSDEPSLAISLYFSSPAWSLNRYYAAYADHLLAIPEYCSCYKTMLPETVDDAELAAGYKASCDYIRSQKSFMDDDVVLDGNCPEGFA
ncbi:uncharacterized protein AMSG_00578 [Thecamonas trahens ATCC 50062]|uniref:JmjC domain-containing protein n=1 Tax=Thecamonas trahens ATCC 50062 TaxID=461836 RepID=A0A0L0DBW3_THETB|nr:hypothetical protein AMSG_00578 [Thecamonas trahens ATCC 50062]KNC48798.1 hypothetical protein AMSG_00578 [Thecamonas trahens ATCC 50062]|eukprot:XP_013762849.1 hypothetical protein AMSG_00578 [Thecamonas trahens ATCC 50062]